MGGSSYGSRNKQQCESSKHSHGEFASHGGEREQKEKSRIDAAAPTMKYEKARDKLLASQQPRGGREQVEEGHKNPELTSENPDLENPQGALSRPKPDSRIDFEYRQAPSDRLFPWPD